MKAEQVADQANSITPLGAGDLIDRAVRFYRRNFWTFILIASPPVIVGTLVSVGWTLAARAIFSIGPDSYSAENTFYHIFLWLGSIIIWLTETIATLVVMGGASRNFVRHLLFSEPLSFRDTYSNVWRRFGGLTVASTFIVFLLGIIGIVVYYFGFLIGFLLIVLIAAAFSSVPILAFVIGTVIGLAVALGTIWLFFLVASRFTYIPQVMLVEGQGIFSAVARSAGLASGNVVRLAALFFFTTVATYSALALLYVPLAWYASAQGVQLMSFGGNLVPAWYEIAYNLIWQISFILLSPVWMVGLCLLYVDERVRREGYDIELMAARRLGNIPSVPTTYINPLQPALASGVVGSTSSEHKDRSSLTTLGLK